MPVETHAANNLKGSPRMKWWNQQRRRLRRIFAEIMQEIAAGSRVPAVAVARPPLDSRKKR
jgi:hypothetical protein